MLICFNLISWFYTIVYSILLSASAQYRWNLCSPSCSYQISHSISGRLFSPHCTYSPHNNYVCKSSFPNYPIPPLCSAVYALLYFLPAWLCTISPLVCFFLAAWFRTIFVHVCFTKKNTSHGNEVPLQDTSHLIQRPFTNEVVRAKIQQAIRPHEDLLTIVKRRKVQWYGHVSRWAGLAKTILQGTVKGGRREDRQRKKWEDNINGWTGLEFAKSQRAVENREKWRKLILLRNWNLVLREGVIAGILFSFF